MTTSDSPAKEFQDIDWDAHLAERTRSMKPSFIREILKLTVKPEIISFAGGLPAPEFFPIREFQEACQHILQTQGQIALQYSPTEGFVPLKKFLAKKLSKYGILVDPDNILMVNGSQQGLDLIGKLFVDPGACVITSRPTYLGALQAWNAYQAHYCTVPMDERGMLVDELSPVLGADHGHRFIYVLPNFHNPAGTTLPLERREALVDLARERDLIIIEDDPYGELRYEGKSITPIFQLAPERTIYLSTFSKTLAPGIRLAWVVAPKAIIANLVKAKQGADLHTSTFMQMVADDICQRGILRQHVERLREHMPQEVSWATPEGGLFLWARTSGVIDTHEFLEIATEKKVAYVPGFAFYPGEDGGHHSMRLNFSNSNEELINEGISRLGIAMKQELASR
jgi:2-aminoadipate transaminase